MAVTTKQPLCINHLSLRQLRASLVAIYQILWHPPDQEWGPDTIDEVAQVLVSNGIGPPRRRSRRRVI